MSNKLKLVGGTTYNFGSPDRKYNTSVEVKSVWENGVENKSMFYIAIKRVPSDWSKNDGAWPMIGRSAQAFPVVIESDGKRKLNPYYMIVIALGGSKLPEHTELRAKLPANVASLAPDLAAYINSLRQDAEFVANGAFIAVDPRKPRATKAATDTGVIDDEALAALGF